jgi:hypothetical protein
VQRQTLDFAESVKKVFDQLGKSVNVKAERQKDTTARPAQFKQAVDAFWKAYNK